MPTISTSKTDYIILSNSANIGTNIYIKSAIITYDSNNDINTFFTSQYGANYKNIIILSQHIINYGADQVTITNNCLITQNNIKNNMKFIHNSSNLNSKILFVQNQNISDNSKNYLLEKI
jgi:hypothetical protein